VPFERGYADALRAGYEVALQGRLVTGATADRVGNREADDEPSND